MNIILNFLPLKAGGGVQVALDFLSQLEQSGHKWYLVARSGTPFEKMPKHPLIEASYFIPDKLFSRIIFENYTCKDLIKSIKPDVIYTQFGPCWPAAKHIKNVVGCAYSNLFYPEIDFWKGLGFLTRMKKHCIDFIRKSNLKKADKVIFETKDLASRSVTQGFLNTENVSYVLPAVSSNVGHHVHHNEYKHKLSILPKSFYLCLISSYSINKNIENLIEVLALLKTQYNRTDIRLILTLPEEQVEVQVLLNKAESLGVSDSIVNLGRIPFDACAEVYRVADLAILPSNLESFSNNIAESWVMDTPLLISDMDWARSLCGNAAVYINQHSPIDMAKQIIQLFDDSSRLTDVVNKGRKKLEEYPSAKQRFFMYLDEIEKVCRCEN